MKTVESSPDLGITKPILLQHFRYGLGPESAVFLDSSSGGYFAHLTLSECKDIVGKNPRKHSLHRVFDEFSDEEEEPMPNTISEPKPIEEEPIFPTIQPVEDCTPLIKTWFTMNHSNHIERLTTPRVISSTSFMMSYLINIGRRNPSREGKETQHMREKKYSVDG
jgi:hypothetical protein